MAVTYMAICIFDFIVGPVFFNVLQVYASAPITMWIPLTLGGGGLFHVAMGAVLGVTAWSRGKEKLQAMEYTAKEEANGTSNQ